MLPCALHSASYAVSLAAHLCHLLHSAFFILHFTFYISAFCLLSCLCLGDVDELPDGMKLKWVELPKTAVHRGQLPQSLRYQSTLENPDVNPMTGAGRSAADVQAELQRLKERTRALRDTAIFQADFLFVQLQGESVQLHRVVHGLCLHDATSDDLSFTTLEYVHHPQESSTYCGQYCVHS